MPLVLQPSLKNVSLEQIQEHVAQVRARRMIGAMEYFNLQDAKVERAQEKVRIKAAKDMDRLARAIAKLDKALDLVEDLVVRVQAYQQELGEIENTSDLGFEPTENEADQTKED